MIYFALYARKYYYKIEIRTFKDFLIVICMYLLNKLNIIGYFNLSYKFQLDRTVISIKILRIKFYVDFSLIPFIFDLENTRKKIQKFPT